MKIAEPGICQTERLIPCLLVHVSDDYIHTLGTVFASEETSRTTFSLMPALRIVNVDCGTVLDLSGDDHRSIIAVRAHGKDSENQRVSLLLIW
jgi:hypothetical protein